MRSGLPRRRAGDRRLLVLAGLLALGLAVQRFPSIAEGIRVQFAHDVLSYEVIARAAPSFPSTHVLRPFAERFPVHWLVGVVSDGAGVSLEAVYRVAMLACVLAIALALHGVLVLLGLDVREYALAAAALVASAYPFHYLLAASGMVADAVLVLGTGVLLLGFARGRLWLVLLGLVLGVIGRQTMVPVALVAAAWAAVAPAWRHLRWRAAAACALVPAAAYLVLHLAASGFADPEPGGLRDVTVLGFLTGVRPIADHLGRVGLGLVVPSALVIGAWLRTRNPLPRGALLVAAAIAVQPVVLGPTSNGANEPRLAGLAAPALAVAAGALLRGARLSRAETLIAGAAIVLAGLHSRYTHGPFAHNYEWGAAELVAAVVLVGILARPRQRAARELGLPPVRT